MTTTAPGAPRTLTVSVQCVAVVVIADDGDTTV